ncbi:hypothetical protein PUN28_017631 [Cardiocondyla obscurior]|uniref:Ribosomal protein L33 n=1 Tax=Cardiocondyla obscurior TaxID=286306 RepID=A0AAW2EJY2_9HYME
MNRCCVAALQNARHRSAAVKYRQDKAGDNTDVLRTAPIYRRTKEGTVYSVITRVTCSEQRDSTSSFKHHGRKLLHSRRAVNSFDPRMLIFEKCTGKNYPDNKW